MSKAGKIFLFAYSSLPLLWTAILLTASYFSFKTQFGFSLFASWADGFFFPSMFIYLYIGIPIWFIWLAYLIWKKSISVKQIILSILLTIIGIFLAYYSIEKNIFCVSGCYLFD